MSRRPRSRPGRGGRGAPHEPPTVDHVRPLVELASRPGALEALDGDALLLVAFQLALYYGVNHDADVGESLGTVYARLVEDVTADERLELLERTTESVRGGATSVVALLPFVQHETDVRVVQAAASSFASLLPPADGDPMTGPRTVRAMLDHADDGRVRAGLLAGLLSLGDRRVLSVTQGAWRALPAEGREALTRASVPFASACVVEFWLAWLEDADVESAPGVAEALARLPREGGGRVLDLERKFPENAPDGEPEIAVLGEWDASDYATRFAERLARLEPAAAAAVESAGVRAAWGLSG